jgi:mannose-6-phosphate isomerase-like protein (cupin superfamily)
VVVDGVGMTTDTTAPYVLARDEGDHRHFLNHLATTKVSPGATGSMSVIEFVAPLGFGPPLHRHHDEDEIMIVHDGEIAFRSGDVEAVATAGATVFLPHGVPHTFQVLSDTDRFTAVTASSGGRPQFDRLVAELGTPLEGPEVPEPSDIDPVHVADVCLANGVDVLGPPPTPLQHPRRATAGERK